MFKNAKNETFALQNNVRGAFNNGFYETLVTSVLVITFFMIMYDLVRRAKYLPHHIYFVSSVLF